MALVVNSNISSLNAQRQLNSSAMDLDQASERLASGRRINSAADDAAGLAISNRQTSQIRGLDQAIRNANDGISLIQTAEGALDESTNILQRMRELAIQSSNGIYSDTDRATLDAEVQQLVAELDRISESTSFNGQNILDGTLGTVDLQVGSESNQTISFSIAEVSTDALGLGSTSGDLAGTSISATLAFDEGDIAINGQGLSSYDSTGSDVFDDLIADISSIDGVSASGFNIFEGTSTADGVLAAGDTFTIALGSTDGSAATTFTIGGTGISTNSTDELVSLINEKTDGAVVAAINADNGRLTLSNATGGSLVVTTAANTGETATGFANGGVTQQGSISISSTDGEAITVTKGANGTDTDLTNFGFVEVAGQGEVVGASISAANQTTALGSGALIINDVTIASDSTNSSLQAKVDNINAVSDTTGVSASITADASFTTDLSKQQATIVGDEAVDITNLATVANAADFQINGVTVDLSGITAADDAASVATIINAATGNTGVTATVNDSGFITLTSDSPFTMTEANNMDLEFLLGTTDPGSGNTTTAAALGANTGSININGTEISNIDLDDLDAAVADINGSTGSTGVTASVDENGELQLVGTSAITLTLGQTQGFATANLLGITFANDTSEGLNAVSDSNSDGENDTIVIQPRIALDSANDQTISVEVSGNATTVTGLTDLNTDQSAAVTGSAISSISVATQAGAQSAVDSIDNALETINSTRSDLGAVNNRLDFTVSNLSNVSENTSAARSRIVDADFASETAALSRAQVLQQASQAMLAQANARPQQVLSLLQ